MSFDNFWTTGASPGTGQFPAMASGVPSGSTGGLPVSGGFPASGVPSGGTFGGFSTPSFSTSPFSGADNINAIPQIAGGAAQASISNALPYYTSGIGALQQYYGQAGGALRNQFGNASNALTQNYGQAAAPFQTLFNQAQPGVDEYAAALGLGPPGAQAQAIADFMASPALQSQLKLGDAAVRARNASTGGTGSGNELLDLDRFNQLVGQQMFPTWLNSLQPYLQQQQGAAQGLGSVYGQLGQQQAGVSTGLGTNLAQLYGGLGQGVSGGLNTIGNMQFATPWNAANLTTQAAGMAENSSNANLAALTGLTSGVLGAGGMLGGAGILKYSDINVKENIEPVGKLADGMNIYRYNYIGDPTPQIGLMAQEVEQVVPEAVGEMEPGIKGVDYAMATNRAAALMRFANDNSSYVPPLVIYGEGLMERAA